MRHKVYVDVTARFDKEGNVIPENIIWEDGRCFEIDRVVMCPAASLKEEDAACVIPAEFWERKPFYFWKKTAGL